MSISDKTFTILADLLVQNTPTSSNSRRAFESYKLGLSKQSDGDYATAFKLYQEALLFDCDPFSRSYIFYNLGILYANLNQNKKSLLFFNQSLALNPLNPSSLNNAAVLYYKLNELENAELYWKEAVRLAPYQYPEAQNWLLLRDT